MIKPPLNVVCDTCGAPRGRPCTKRLHPPPGVSFALPRYTSDPTRPHRARLLRAVNVALKRLDKDITGFLGPEAGDAA